MGKPKNKSKGKELVDSDSDVDLVEEGETEEKNKPAGKVSKKEKRKKKKDDDWEDDIADELATLSMEANKGREEEVDQNGLDEPIVTKKEKKKKKKGRQEESDEEEQAEEMPVPQGKKKPAASFQMLMMDDDDDEDKSQSEDEKSEEESQPVQKTEPSKQQKKKEKKKKGGKEKTTEEEDVDALLAEIDKPKEKSGKKSKKDKKKEKEAEAMEAEDDENQNEAEVTEVVKVEPKVITMEDLEEEEEDDRKKRKKKKGKKEEEEAKEGDNEEEEEGGTMKSAAQKRKEKKEREKQKKMADKKKQALKKEEKTEEKKDEQEKSEEKLGEASGATAVTEEHGEEKGSGDEGEEEGGKKKKKKKKGEKEEKEKKKTKKAPVAAIKEILKKQKEEEERLQREEEERIRKEEEAIRLREEQKRLEEERKQKKKEKEKARKERLKQEGKLLTEKQKQDKRRAMQLLESMKEQGLELPQKDDDEEKKPRRPVYHDKKRKKQQQKTDESQEAKQETPSPDETPASTPMAEEAPTIEVEVTDKVGGEEEVKVTEEEVKDTWEEDTKDAWDASSEEEEEDEEDAAPPKEVTKPAPVQETKKVEVSVKEEKEESEEESEEEEEEESDEESEEEESEESESSTDDEDLTPYERAENKIMKLREQFEKKRSTDVLRAPVVCVLGHVDTGKTKILDKLRRTNVQDGEAGGITQQIGATNVPEHALREKTTMCKEFQKKELKLPGLLIIDTPGHESFSNLRSRGSSLCDIAILVIDIMHGLEPQTIESINLLKEKKTPFVVALNKIDRLYQWKSNPNSDVVNTIKRQTQMCKQEFDERSRDAITQLAEQGLNAALFYENKNPKEYISMVPTSAHSGDGMGNLVALICELTQNWMAKKLSFSEELQATVMEVKALPGLGTTVDVILVNGTLHEGDHIVIAGTEGPISTQIRGLLMPQPMRELRVKSQYEHHKEVNAAQGVKIIGKDLEKALAGLPMYVAHDDDEVEYYKEEISKALKDILSSIKLSERGVFVQASTLGSLEALLEFLRTEKIPYAGINIGPVHKKDIMKASIMLEHDSQYAVILAFDVKVERDAQEMADNLGVTIFTADIIYHLQDKFTKFREDLKRQKQEEFKHIAVFPCKLRVLPNCIFNSRDPIVIGVSVEAGFVKNGTPICVPSKDFVDLGRVTSIEVNHKPVELARKGQEVCIKIENIPGETPKLYGRHFDHTDMLVSKVSRASIDAVKDYFRDDMTKPDWALMVELKKLFQVL